MKEPPPIILGIDPGTRISGYGIIRVDENGGYTPLDYGCIRPPPQLKLSERYLIIFDSIEQLIEHYAPQVLAIEMQYVCKNVQSTMKLTMARSAAMIAAKKRGLKVFGFAPTQAKRAVVGTGRASKYQVQGMIQRLLNLSQIPEPEDAADALALAICYVQAAPHLVIKHEL